MAGKSYLKFTGVLMALIGVAGIVITGVLDLVLGWGISIDHAGIGGTMVMIIGIAYLVWAAFNLVAGLYGIKYSNDASKAKTCSMFGLISIVIALAVSAWHLCTLIATTPTAPAIISASTGLIVSIIIPVFYLYGALLNTKNN
ncbi:MAG: hypothetical protein RSA70_02490 [Clostridia bacterium]